MQTALQVRSASLPRNRATTSRSVSPLSSYADSMQLRKAYYSQHGFSHVDPIVTNLKGEIRTSLESGVGKSSLSNASSASLEEMHHQRSNNGINIVDLQQMPFFVEDDSDEVVYPRTDMRVVTPELTSTSEKSDFSFPSPEINTAKLCPDHSKKTFTPDSTMLPFYENTVYSTNLSSHFEDKQTTECLSINDIFLEKLTLSSPSSESNEISLTRYALLDDGSESVSLPAPIKARRSLSMNDAQYKPPKTTGDSFQRSDFLRPRAVSDRDISLHEPWVPNLLDFSPPGSEPSCNDTTEKSGLQLAGINIDILSPSPENLNLMLDEFTAKTFGTSKGTLEVDTVMGDGTVEAFQELLDLSLNITEFTTPHIPMPTDVQFQGLRNVELFQQLLDISLGINDSNHTPVAAPGELLDLSISVTEPTNPRIPMPAEILFDELRNIDPYILRDLDKPDDLEEYTHPPASGLEEETSEGIDLFQKWLDVERFEDMIEKARSAVFSIISDKRRCKVLLGCENALAQSFLNVIQMLIDLSPTNICSDDDKGTLFIALHRLAKASLLHPRCLSVEGVKITSIHPVTFGHFGDVFKGTLKEIPVCVKMLRSCETMDLKKLSREYQKEVIMWSHTAHANVLPFYGTYYDEVRERLCLLSPWMENGNITTYLSRDNSTVNRILLIGDIINGIAYLHQNNIVHGDLKAANILVTESGRACLADFGLSAKGLNEAWTHVDSSANGSGTIRWQAPELFHYTHSTNASDIYAFAGVCYEIFTGKFPFYEIPNEYPIIVKITEGQHSSRPEPLLHGLTSEIWHMMEQCWDKVPGKRPSVEVIMEVISSTGVKDTRPPPEDSEVALWNLRKIIHRSSDYVSIKDLEEVISWAEAH